MICVFKTNNKTKIVISCESLLKAIVCRHNPKISFLVSTTLVTPHKINNSKLKKKCVTLKKPSQKPQIHVKPTTYFGKQCTDISRASGNMTWQFDNSGAPNGT
jgi:hypothetical protein